MPRVYRNGVVTVTSEPTLVVAIPPGVDGAIVQNLSDKVTAYIGGKDVAAKGDSRGIRLKPGSDPLVVPSYEFEPIYLYAVAVDSDVEIAFLVST